jgi:hypothetical protein
MRPTWRAAAPLPILLGILTGCGKAGTPAPVNPGPTPAAAMAVARQLADLPDSRVLEVSGGAVLQVERAYLRVGGPSSSSSTSSAVVDAVAVPHQSGYPQQFMMAVHDSNSKTLALVTKAGAKAPWLVVDIAVIKPPATLPAFALDAQGYAKLIDTSHFGDYAYNLGLVPVAYVHAISPGTITGDDEFAPGPLPKGEQDLLNSAQHEFAGLGGSADAKGQPVGSVFAYATADGGVVALLEYTFGFDITAPPGILLPVKADTFPPTAGIHAGRYRHVTMSGPGMVALTDPAKGSGDGKLHVLSDLWVPTTGTAQ